MILKSCKYVLIGCLFGLVLLADRAHADPVDVPGMERVPGGKAWAINDRMSCPGPVNCPQPGDWYRARSFRL